MFKVNSSWKSGRTISSTLHLAPNCFINAAPGGGQSAAHHGVQEIRSLGSSYTGVRQSLFPRFSPFRINSWAWQPFPASPLRSKDGSISVTPRSNLFTWAIAVCVAWGVPFLWLSELKSKKPILFNHNVGCPCGKGCSAKRQLVYGASR